MSNYRVCTNCVMDTSDSKIRFGNDGVCDHCRVFYTKILPRWPSGEAARRELDEIVSKVKRDGRGKDFDCVVGVSGGVDSSYLTYVAAAELGLRPLVLHVDTGWNSQEAVNNVEVLIDGLGLDLHTEVINWDEMRDLQLAFFKSGVPHIDMPQDHAIMASLYKFAEKHSVHHILTGANLSTECIRNPIEWMWYQTDSKQLLDIHRRFGTRPLSTFPTTSALRHKVYLRYVKGIRVHRLLNLVDYRKDAAIRRLTDEVAWQTYPQKHFESRFTRFYEGYWLPTRFGYDTRRVQYSSLIVTGQMTRDAALELLAGLPYEQAAVRRDLEYVAAKLGVSVDDVRGFHKAPKRTFRDFRSQYWTYTLGAAAMRLLRLELGGKR